MKYSAMENSVYTDRSYCVNNDGLSVLGMPYADDLIEVIRSDGNLDEFLEVKNSKFKSEWLKRHTETPRKDKTKYENDLQNYDRLLDELARDEQLVSDINTKSNSLRERYPENRRFFLDSVLKEYVQTGQMSEKILNRLKEKPKGLFDRIKNGGKIKKANRELEEFLQYCQSKKVYQQLQGIDSSIRESSVQEGSADILQPIKVKREQLAAKRQETKNFISQVEISIQNVTQDFEQRFSPQLQKEDEIIRTFVQEVKTSPQSKNGDYIEGLDTLPDDKLVMFSFTSTCNDYFSKILKLQNLKEGSGTDEWFVVDGGRTSPAGCFSPVMTAKEAKEVMPTLLALRDKCPQHFGVTSVIDAESFLAPLDNRKSEVWGQEKIDQELDKLMHKLISDQCEKESWSQLGTASRQKLCKIYGADATQDNMPPEEFGQKSTTLEGIKKKYPAGEYLFSGVAVSDDYFSASARPDRNAYIEATPALKYARVYSCACSGGLSGTDDRYIDSFVGHACGHRISVGFINVYKEHEDQVFYPNFGIETKATPMPKDEAHQHYEAETLIHKDKNPQVAKLLHVVATTKTGAEQNFFLEIPEHPDEFMQYLLDQRKADYANTFRGSMAPVLERLKAQKQEFDRGIIHGNQPLVSRMQEEQSRSMEQNSSVKEINPAVVIQSKRGIISQSQEAIKLSEGRPLVHQVDFSRVSVGRG